MTKEERDRLIIEELGECWHKYNIPFGIVCLKCGFHSLNPDLSTPEGFFWWWSRGQREEWWPDFYDYLCVPGTNIFDIENIDPDRGADALAEFLIQRKENK